MKYAVETPKRKKAYPSKFPDMDDEQYSKWTALLEQRLGVVLPENRKSFLVTNVGMRMRELGFDNYDQYLEHLNTGHRGNVEWNQLVHHLTVHETRFLRNQSTIKLICEKFLPQGRQFANKPLTINAWSVGCATGEEPYTMAMAIDEHMSRIGCNYYLGIMASDISRSALAIGRTGIYSALRVKDVSDQWLQKYFIRCEGGKFEVIPELKQRICFNQLNILEMDDMATT
ncbi:MAG: protein-glutamate O-methyltransferase CheR, partial [Gammaproteobacteria bacterium]|nr:protein-glutamate O-methyltransferase CheR [Gammaproteobacteria bacterium]